MEPNPEELAETLENLVIRAQAGDAEAYAAIVARFQDMALSYAYSILGDYDLAQDVRQEAFLGAYCDLLALRNPAAFPGWFRQIVYKHSLSVKRGRHVLTVPIEAVYDLASGDPGPVRCAERKEVQQTVSRALERLPQAESEVVRLFYLEGHSLQEVGQQVGVPSKTVQSRLHTARARLRQRLVGMAKEAAIKQHLSGDKRLTQDAASEAIAQFEDSVQTLLKVPSAQDQLEAGRLLFAKGAMFRFLGQHEQSIVAFQQAMKLPPLKASPAWKARFRTEMGITLVRLADYPKARKELQSARSILDRNACSEPGAVPEERRSLETLRSSILNGLGACCWGEGDFAKARRFYEEALDESRKGPFLRNEWQALHNLALLDWKDGRLEEALQKYRTCLRHCKTLRERFGKVSTLMNTAIIEESLGLYRDARRHYSQALTLAREINYIGIQTAIHGNLGNLALVQEKWREALLYNGQALKIARQIKDPRSGAIALENLALTYLGLKRPRPARRTLRDGRDMARAIGDQERLFGLDLVEIELDLAFETCHDTLTEKVRKARQNLKAHGYYFELPRLLRLAAAAHRAHGEVEKARRTLEEALRESQKQRNQSEMKRILALERQLESG